jgi:hypothetical protein
MILRPGQAGIAHGSADHKTSGGIDVILGVLVEQVGGNHGLNDMLQNVGAQFVVAHAFGMLRGDDDGIHALHFVLRIVFHRDLGFAIGPQVRASAILADFRKFLGELMGQ